MIRARTTSGVLVAALLAAALAGCGSVESPPVASPPPLTAGPTALGATLAGQTIAPTLDRAAGWRADLASLVPGMAAIHPNLTHGTSRTELDAAAAALSATVDTATDDQLLVGVLRIAALVSRAGCDAHTGGYIWANAMRFPAYAVDSLPMRLWLFGGEDGDEVVVVDALPPYEALVGSRIDTIEGHPDGRRHRRHRPDRAP